MNAARHMTVSAAAGIGVGVVSGSVEIGGAFFLAGWAIDLDHFVDFALHWGPREAFRRMARLGVGPVNTPGTAFLFLHGFEISAVLLILAASFQNAPWILGVAMGHFSHLLLDQMTNARGFNRTYFLTYRAVVRFDHRICFPKREVDSRLPGPDPQRLASD